MNTLILVDDEPLALSALSTLIKWEDYGFRLLKTFTRGEDAIDFIEKNHPTLVITDIKMPKITGIDIARHCFNSHCPTNVAFMSAYRDFEYARNALSYGVSEYIEKPIKKKDIVALLKKTAAPSFFAKVNTDSSNLEQIFSDLLYGIITDERELNERFLNLGMPSDTAYSSCAVFTLHINDFEGYLKNTWHHQTENLYQSISYVVSEKNPYCYAGIVRYSYNNIEIITIFDASKKDLIKTYLQKTLTELSDLLKLSVSVTKSSYYAELSELLIRPAVSLEQTEQDNEIIREANEFIKNNYQKAISSRDAANHVMLSNSYFCNFYKKHTGSTFLATLNKYRIIKACELLAADKSLKPSSMYKMVGFFNQGYFYETFKQIVGVTPAEFQNNPTASNGERL